VTQWKNDSIWMKIRLFIITLTMGWFAVGIVLGCMVNYIEREK
jgi:hypothetical protein